MTRAAHVRVSLHDRLVSMGRWSDETLAKFAALGDVVLDGHADVARAEIDRRARLDA